MVERFEVKTPPFIFLLLAVAQLAVGQTDPVKVPNKEYAVYRYDATLMANLLTYRYDNLWDIDGDLRKDTVYFVSNGGAHAYYHLEVGLSSSDKRLVYPSFLIDMPYYLKTDPQSKLDGPIPQFVVKDFDGDGKDEIYLNLNNGFAKLPHKLVQQGVTAKRILLDHEDNKLVVKEFQ